MIALLAACTDPPPPAAQAELILDAGWSAAPWEQESRSPQLHIKGTFSLPEAPGAGSVLVVEGAWWHLTATVNGQVLPAVTGGITAAEIPVGPHLRPGDNTLALQIAAPSGVDPILTGGSLSSVGRDPGAAWLDAPPRLLLRPEVHVANAWLTVEGEALTARAEVVGATEGATVRFSASRDGAVLADLGVAPVRAGAAAITVDSPLPSWSPGEASLLHLHAALHGSDGARLDEAVVRTGARALSTAPLSINGEALRLMGARVVNRDPATRLHEVMAGFAPAGINAAEIHGETLRRDWLQAADELGLPLVVVPRCIGRSSRHSGDREATLATLAAQDAATARLLRSHPSVVLLAAEGPAPQRMPLWTEALTEAGIPIAGRDLPARVLSLKATDNLAAPTRRCQPKDCRGAWLVELTPWWRTVREGEKPESRQRWQLLSAALIDFMTQEGAIGAIVPSPNPREVDGWTAAWRQAAEALSIPAVSGTGRGRSEVVVTGAAPGQTVWLSAPLAPTVGAIADAAGTARLSLWHDGAATVRVGQTAHPVTLTPGRWSRFTWQPAVVSLSLPQ